MNNLSWRGIRAFILVAEQGSFTAAAEAGNFSKANLSQLVTELENSLGVQLLHRTTRSLRLTEVGEGYYQRCQKAMQALDSAGEWASQTTHELRGAIRMNSVGGAIGEELVAPLIMEFHQAYPQVEIRLDYASTRVDLIEQHYDLVVRMGQLPDSSLIARKLTTIHTRHVASPGFLRGHDAIEQPEDLKGLPLIFGSVDHWQMHRGQDKRIVRADHGLKIVSGRAMRKAALAGLGITRIADVYCQADINQGRLVEVLPDWSEETPISLVCPPLRHQLLRVKTLMDWLTERFHSRYQELLVTGP